MVAATFYSVLLYGAQTYFELSHLPVSKFVDEICKGHQAQRPDSIPLKLWEVIAANLLHLDIERMSMDMLLEHLENYKSSLGPDLNKLHEVKSGFSPICAEDIKRGCFDSKGSFKEWDAPNRFLNKCEDITEQKEGCLHELVSFKMNHMTRMTLCMLDHRNLLSIKEILNCFPATKLISRSLGDYTESLDQVACNMDHGKLLSCLEQVASAMMYLHSSKIIHCDLRCSYIYVTCGPSFSEVVAKVGRLGRAVCLPDTGSEGRLFVPYVRKIMPIDAEKWAAPEVRNAGLYSRASDVFTFGLVVWEALTTCFTNLHMYKLLKPFHLLNSKEVLKFTEEILKFTDEENISDKELEKLTPLILCMKACWNSNPTRRHPFSSILELVMKVKDAYRVSNDLYYNTTSEPSVANEDTYDSVYFRSEIPKEDVYSCVFDPDPAAGHANDNSSVYENVARPEPLEGSSLYFSKKEKWGEVVSEFETGKGIERSPVSFYNPKQANMYTDTGINWKKKLKSGKSRML
ncbi:PREDICTED: insulin-like growth factor 1 receptor [Gavialis gangeticus]|uniref:insulin-like growth factor 1 receptor n=1 Tax=Gavialis gangeticus TaxID=94835 RepID=UPI00092EEFBE|nr:PREDICTED: insulin-like growth factor 1 receptor [Gavialis gangeticus]